MKNISKLSAIISCLIVAISISVLPVSAKTTDGGDLLSSKYEKQKLEFTVDENDILLQKELNKLYQNIETDMKINNHRTSSVLTCQSVENYQQEYVDTYAGSYINEDQLVVCVSDKEVLPETSDERIVYRVVENSYNDLVEQKDSLSSKYEELYDEFGNSDGKEIELLDSIAGFGVDEELNAVIVDVVGLTKEKEDLFIRLFEDSNIIFQETGKHFEDNATYKPGRAIYVITNRNGTTITYSRLSIGYRAYLKTSNGYSYGFVTAAHGVKDSIDDTIYSSTTFNTVIGTVPIWVYGGSVDTAFVEITSKHKIGTTTHYSNSSGSTSNGDLIATYTYMSSIAKGSTVYKVGSTTYKTSATVKNINYDFTVDGQKFTNLTKTGKLAESGDSGGLVYMYYDGKYIPAGIIKGGGGAWIFSYSVYVKASEVINQMNVYPY